jgi:hypothetical protein
MTDVMNHRVLQWCGIVFSLTLFVFLDWIVYRIAGMSFIAGLVRGSTMPLTVFIAGCVIGMGWEYVGQFALGWWHYPSTYRRRWLLALLPFFWGLFMLIMQDGYAIARIEGLSPLFAVVVSTVVLGLLIECINVFTESWIYTGWGSSLPLLVLGWLILLAYTFVIGFNAFLLNPFGF